MTLIAVYNSKGGCVGRCDSKCYNAKTETCVCICGGLNHGAGRKQALENTRELQKKWIENWKKSNPGTEFVVPGNQFELFREG